MNIIISYFLDEHGWSSCWIQSNGKILEISISHIYPEDPIEGCLNALIGIMKGDSERKFNWYSEPGANEIIIREIPNEKHKVQFKVIGISKEYSEKVNDLDEIGEIIQKEFEIKKVQLVRMFFYEFKKTSELMKDNVKSILFDHPNPIYLTRQELV